MMDGIALIPGGSSIPEKVNGLIKSPTANAGLVWERYLPIWQGGNGSFERIKNFKSILDEFIRPRKPEASGNKVGLLNRLLKERQERLHRALERMEKQNQFREIEFRLQWRLASGLGNNHPTENGFTFDRVTGAPYLTGSSVKGVCRCAAQFNGVDPETINTLFGPEQSELEQTGGLGSVVFFDAFPTGWPTLAVDVINCHHSSYYGHLSDDHCLDKDKLNKDKLDKGKRVVPPRETESPVPAFFLTVDQGAHFMFTLMAKSHTDLNQAARILEQGLEMLGIGAKTAVGYGIFKKV